MNCEQAQALLDDQLDGMTGDPRDADAGANPGNDAQLTAALDRHLAACAACRADRDSLLALAARTRALPRERAPARDLWPDIARRLEPRAPARRWLMVAALPAAAALALVAGTLGPRLLAPDPRAANPPPPPAGAQIGAQAGAQA